MASVTYNLSGATEFVFPYPVITGNQLTVEIQPGGVLPTSQYEIIGLGPSNTQVTIVYPDAPTDGTKEIKITRYVQPDRVGVINEPSDITVTNLNNEFDNVYMAVVDTTELTDFFYGSSATNPTVSPQGNPVTEGDIYYNTTSNELRVYNGTAWVTVLANAGLDDVPTNDNYLRTLGAWILAGDLATEDDVPFDSQFYLRSNGAWAAAGEMALVDNPANTLYGSLRDGAGWRNAGELAIEADVPNDGLNYVRFNGAWVTDPIQDDAPADGTDYVRNNNTWATITSGVGEAPQDSSFYSRYNGTWQKNVIQSEAPHDFRLYSMFNGDWFPNTIQGDAPSNPGDMYARENDAWTQLGNSALKDTSYFQQNLGDVRALEVGSNLNADAAAYIDFHTETGAEDYSARFIRNGGAAGNFEFYNNGGGRIYFNTDMGGNIEFVSSGTGGNFTYNNNAIWHTGNLPAPFGYTGSYSDDTAVRSFYTQYTNSGYTPELHIVTVDSGAAPGLNLVSIVGGVVVHEGVRRQVSSIEFLVPPGKTYQVQASAGTTLKRWTKFSL